MTEGRVIVLDNEAVQALANSRHPKHRRALAIAEQAASGTRDRSERIELVVPTTVRVEAGWDRRSPHAAIINRLRVSDASLDSQSADQAARTRRDLHVSVADAHVATVLSRLKGVRTTVVTSDVDDMTEIVNTLGLSTVIVRI